jgi:hypothetical protein
MVSLLKLATITEDGVRFLSPHDGTPMYVTLSCHANTASVVLHTRPCAGHLAPTLDANGHPIGS